MAVVTCALLPMAGCKNGIRDLMARLQHRPSKLRSAAPANNVEKLIATPKLTMLRWPNFADDQANVRKFYGDRDDKLAWTSKGRPTVAALQWVRLFQDAAAKGLNPDDYDASQWQHQAERLNALAWHKNSAPDVREAVAKFDVAMTIDAMRYLEDLHVGRLNPQSLNFDIDVPAKRAAFNVATLLNDKVVHSRDVADVAESVEPRNDDYKATELALSSYIALASAQQSAPVQPLPHLPDGSKPVGVGGYYAAVPQLWARLQMEDHAPARAADAAVTHMHGSKPRSYNARVSAAVKLYQQRHGLQDDGRLGDATIASLNVPMSVRVRELDDALERWRWLPDNYIQPRVLVNLPEFMLRAYNPDRTLAFKMRIVIGEVKGDHNTPMFVRLMRYVVFRPYWNLPPSIIKKDLLPHVQKAGLAYLPKNDYEVYKGDGSVVTNYTEHDLEHLRYNVRQMPGPKNSLGLVKFLFPNAYDVYMHSTPELMLFGLSRRDRSHGCVRLQYAGQMALWVLQGDQKNPDDENGWDADKIDAAMTGDLNNKTVGLRTPLPVVLGYFTAMAEEDGTIHFFNDIYGYDKQLEDALAKGRPYERAEMKINPTLIAGETE